MNRMVTTCPNCRQLLAVSAADLRVGQGYVRCGRCEKVFNALLTLEEEAAAPESPADSAHGTDSVPALEDQDAPPAGPEGAEAQAGPPPEQDAAEAEPPAPALNTDEAARSALRIDADDESPIFARHEGKAREELPPLPGHEDELAIPFGSMDEDEVEVTGTHVTGRFRSIVLEGGNVHPEQETDPGRDELALEILRQATQAPIDVLLTDEDMEVPPAPAPDATASRRAPAQEDPPPQDFDADAVVGNRPRPRGWWYVAAILLLLALAGQYAHHNRARLVTVPWLTGPMQALYTPLGLTVEPVWDLASYEVSVLDYQADSAGPGTLALQAAVALDKSAPWGQPPPLLRAVLSDNFGNVVATHDLSPQQWSLGAVPARIKPGERLDARLSIVAPNQVSGFDLYPCLPDASGTVRCKGDPAP